ncbi:hypothetical protein ZWY2020_031978 [Hordeum vulgare]|nr:hypothetical protein ZWY2020_031978 [Hordeum vulgare]
MNGAATIVTARREATVFIMDLTEILNVRFHIGGEFVRHGSNLEYVGGDEEMSEIERDKLPFQEVKEPAQDQEEEEYVQLVDDVFVTDCSGVITEVIKSPAKQPRAGRVAAANDELPSQLPISQVCNPTQDARPTEYETEQLHPVHPEHEREEYQPLPLAQIPASSLDSDSDPEYMAHSDDSGENSEVVEMRRHARKFKKRMRDTKSWIGMDPKAPIPVELISNMEDQLEGEEKDWEYDSSDEDYSYDEDSDGVVSGSASAGQATTASAGQATTAPSRFRPPRQTTGASGSGARGATRHRGRKDAEDYPSYKYFTVGSGGQD